MINDVLMFIQAMNWLILLSCFIAVQQSNVAAAYVPNPEDVYSSLAFVFDTTGSMQDDFRQLKSHAEDIMTFVLNRNNTDIKHFVFVPFNDPGEYGVQFYCFDKL